MFLGKKAFMAAAIAAAAVVSLSACSSPNSSTSSSAGETTVNVAFPTWAGYGALYIAKQKGFFAKHHLNVNLSIVEGLDQRKQALASGTLDALATSADVTVSLASAGIPMKISWVFDISNGSDGIVYNKTVFSIKDLRGKQIAVEQGTTDYYFLMKVLQQHGMGASDVKIVNMTTADAGAAFVGGKVPVAVTYDPYLSQAKAAGGTTYTTKDDPIPLIDILAFTDKFIQKNPQAVKEFSAAMSEASTYAAQNPRDASSIEAAGLQMKTSDVDATLKVLKLYSLADNVKQFGTSGTSGALYTTIKDYSDFYYANKLISKAVDASSVINPAPVRALGQS